MSPFAFQKFGRKMLGIGAVALSLTMAACGAGGNSISSTSNASLTACHVTSSDLQVSGSSAATPTPPAKTAGISGTIQIDGSSALQPLFAAAAPTFDSANGTHTTATANGSGHGLADAEAGSVNIGLSDFFAQESPNAAQYGDLVDHRVAAVAFTLVVSSDIKDQVQNLTTAEIQQIYTGKITNWAQIGGPNEAIEVINRPLVSGTRATFRKYVLNGTQENAGQTLTQDTTGAVATALSKAQGAIGYVATGFVLNQQYSGSIFPICIDGYGATTTAINAGNYKFWSYEHAYTKGPAGPAEQALIDYVESSAVQNTLVPTLGFLQVSQLTDAAKATHPLPAGAQ